MACSWLELAAGCLTATEMLLYSLLALSRLCCMTALASTVVPSGSSAIWCGLRVDLNASTSLLQGHTHKHTHVGVRWAFVELGDGKHREGGKWDGGRRGEEDDDVHPLSANSPPLQPPTPQSCTPPPPHSRSQGPTNTTSPCNTIPPLTHLRRILSR